MRSKKELLPIRSKERKRRLLGEKRRRKRSRVGIRMEI